MICNTGTSNAETDGCRRPCWWDCFFCFFLTVVQKSFCFLGSPPALTSPNKQTNPIGQSPQLWVLFPIQLKGTWILQSLDSCDTSLNFPAADALSPINNDVSIHCWLCSTCTCCCHAAMILSQVTMSYHRCPLPLLHFYFLLTFFLSVLGVEVPT